MPHLSHAVEDCRSVCVHLARWGVANRERGDRSQSLGSAWEFKSTPEGWTHKKLHVDVFGRLDGLLPRPTYLRNSQIRTGQGFQPLPYAMLADSQRVPNYKRNPSTGSEEYLQKITS